jgi:hypothetical protein
MNSIDCVHREFVVEKIVDNAFMSDIHDGFNTDNKINNL